MGDGPDLPLMHGPPRASVSRLSLSLTLGLSLAFWYDTKTTRAKRSQLQMSNVASLREVWLLLVLNQGQLLVENLLPIRKGVGKRLHIEERVKD